MTIAKPITIKGYVNALSSVADEDQARVAVVAGEREYRIIPRGAGVDLDDHVTLLVEVTGMCTEDNGVLRLQVRGYTLLEDDSWLDDA